MDMRELGFIDINHDRLKELNKPYKIYAELLDEIAQEQFYDVLSQEHVRYAVLMPDAHAGYAMPIGGVCASDGFVVPSFVGFDIGCGMSAYKTTFYKDEVLKKANEIYVGIVSTIPLGFSKHKNHQSFKCEMERTEFCDYILQTKGLMQLGTLGGGNHFIEIGYGSDDMAWIVIHSGSRGFGHTIASHYMREAYMASLDQENIEAKLIEDFTSRNKTFMEHNPQGFEKALKKYTIKQKIEMEKKTNSDKIEGIHALSIESKLGIDYIKDQNFALEFALENRKKMTGVICEILSDTIGKKDDFEYHDESRFINRNHNHAEFDEEIGLWIHRKGATHAKEGMMGVIPGNMRDGSFVVRGKGSKDSLCSSSHGAGRVMSRKQANANISFEKFTESMDGIVGTINENTIDESPFAYKDIFEVMRLQDELVEVVEHIKVLINIKDSTPSKYK